MSKEKKTNAARLLDREGVSYELIPYLVDEHDLSAAHVAASLGEDAKSVFKTIVLRGDKQGYLVCVVPGDSEVDLKRAAKASPLTGYIRGGCSPIGMKKHFPTYFDASAEGQPFIYVSAGVRGLQLKVAPADLLRCCAAVYAPLTPDEHDS